MVQKYCWEWNAFYNHLIIFQSVFLTFFLVHASKEYLDVIWPMLWIISLFWHFSVAPFLITVIETVLSSAGQCVLLCSSFLSLKLFALTSSDLWLNFVLLICKWFPKPNLSFLTQDIFAVLSTGLVDLFLSLGVWRFLQGDAAIPWNCRQNCG